MEILDYYDENHNYLGKEDRQVIHKNALWHDTVHCWLFDKSGNVYFQIRKDEGTLYTTASGHVLSGESVKEAFGREVKEEIGVDVDYNKADLVNIYVFKMDKIKKDGTEFKDRAFANVYICEFNGSYSDFNFDKNELDGLVKVNVKSALELFKNGNGKIEGETIKFCDDKIQVSNSTINFSDFLVNENETAITKYGDILEKILKVN
jgi:isopentenyldiphosphate isomerase